MFTQLKVNSLCRSLSKVGGWLVGCLKFTPNILKNKTHPGECLVPNKQTDRQTQGFGITNKPAKPAISDPT